jgi:CRP-like cAMP-binding protein
MTELEKYITTTMGVAEGDVQRIASFFQPVTLLKGEYYLKAGRMSERLGFVQDGILREYVVRDGQEVTKWICTKGYFVVDLSAFIFRQPARFNLQALTDMELHVIDAASYKRIIGRCSLIGTNWRSASSHAVSPRWRTAS